MLQIRGGGGGGGTCIADNVRIIKEPYCSNIQVPTSGSVA